MRRLRRLAWWLAPPAVCLAVYWPGLRAWFEQDDFAWLALRGSIHSLRDLLTTLFAPMAQGTLRPLDRTFFLVGYQLFGTWALPYHFAVFLTQLAAVALLAAVARRVTRSSAAGFLAALFWVANTGLIVTLSWVSAYNQVLASFFVLAAFYCLLRQTETGRRRWLLGEWAAFLLGLGTLETMAVYPLLAAAWLATRGRKQLRRTVPFFAASAVYLAVHYFVQPYRSADPAYVLHFNPVAGAAVLWRYWEMALGAVGLTRFFSGFPPPLIRAATLLLTLGLGGFAIASALRRRWPALFGIAWFLIALAPVLPLRDHVSSYYLTLPAIGLALAGAAAVSAAFSSRRWRLAGAASLLAGVYLACGVVEGRLGSAYVRDLSFRGRTVVLGAYRAHQLHPGKALVFANVDEALFWAAFYHRPFTLWGVPDVYIDPLSAEKLPWRPGLDPLAHFTIPGPLLRRALVGGRAVVYEEDHRRLRGVSLQYMVRAMDLWRGEPSRVDVGSALYSDLLGPTWYKLEDNRRWMPQFATVRLAGPAAPGEQLILEGWCPPEQIAKGPLRFTVTVAGAPLPTAVVVRKDGPFQAALPLPDSLLNLPTVEVGVVVDRTFRAPGDKRDLGLVFGSFEIR